MGIGSMYLVFYNAIQLFGWSYILVISSLHLVENLSVEGLWTRVHVPLKIFQTWMAIEVVHSAVGLVRSAVITTLMQILSRVFIVWLILHSVPVTRVQPGLVLCVVMWSVAEISRYSYYLTGSLTNNIPAALTWIRYSMFLVLYPAGVLGETLCVYHSLPAYSDVTWSLQTGAFNASVSVRQLLIGVIMLYIPGLSVMYSHMLSQRRRMLAKINDNRKIKRP